MATKPNLTGFQRDILPVLSREGAAYGIEIKNRLQEYRDEPVQNSRVYENLTRLAEIGLVDKSRDGRIVNYRLTERGEDVFETYKNRWLA